jgi:hypothetical protein
LLKVYGRVRSMIIGYARVSTEEQHLDAQISALEAIGAERIFAEKISGTKKSRPELDRMIEQLRDGDVVVVAKYDRASWRRYGNKAQVFVLWLKTSTPRHQQADWSSTSLHPLPSSSASVFLSEPRKGLPLPASEDVLAVGLLHCPQSVDPKWPVCAIRRAVALQSWRVCSRLVRTP